MKIAFLAWHGSIHTRRWVSWFADRGHDVHVITCGGAERGSSSVASESGAARYSVHDLGLPRPAKVGYLLKVPATRRLLRRLDPDVVHAHFATSYGMLGIASWDGPLVVTAHGDDVLIAPRRRHLRAVVTRVLASAGVITVPARHMAEAVRELVPDSADRVHVFQYGVNLEHLAGIGMHARFERSRREESGAIHIVSTRAHLPLYRLDAIIDACAILQHEGRRIMLSIAGDGPERERLGAHAAALLDPDSYRFVGHLPPDELAALVASGDLYASVAESDGTSLSLLEAMSLGAVPVVSDIPANTDWIEDGVNGAVCPIEPAALAQAMMRALSLRRGMVEEVNRAKIEQRGDFHTNMAHMEQLIEDFAGVRFDDPGTTRSRRGKAA